MGKKERWKHVLCSQIKIFLLRLVVLIVMFLWNRSKGHDWGSCGEIRPRIYPLPSRAPSPVWSCETAWGYLNWIKAKIPFLVIPATFQVPNSHPWLVAPIVDSTNIDSYHHCRKFFEQFWITTRDLFKLQLYAKVWMVPNRHKQFGLFGFFCGDLKETFAVETNDSPFLASCFSS